MEDKIDGLWIPIEILQDKALQPNEKIVLSIIKALDRDRGCFASNQYIATLLGLEKRSITAIVSKLSAKGYIEVQIFGYNERKITVISKEQPKENIVNIETRKTKESNKKALPGSKFKTIPKKVQKFNAIDERNWDFDEIERLERERINRRLNEGS